VRLIISIMTKEINQQTPIKSWDTALQLMGFFHTFTAKEILANDEKFKFWQRHFLESDEANTGEFRREFLRIGDMINALAGIANQFTDEQVKTAIDDLNSFRDIHAVIIAQKAQIHD